jgi:hypothetical protein
VAIKHAVPAGLPTGTVAGKVAGDDWRADHVHVPFEVALMILTSATAPAAASATVNTELFSAAKPTRNLIDLSQATQVRLVAMVLSNGGTTSAAVKLSYVAKASEASTWAGTDAGASVVLGTGTTGITRDSGWQTLAAGARVDNCVVAAVVGAAFGTTTPTIGALTAFFR